MEYIIINKLKFLGLSIFIMLIFTSCEDKSTADNDKNNRRIVIKLPKTFTINAGRTLGSQCAQCHGTNGVSTNKWDSIAGEDDLVDEVYEHNNPIMDAQIKGYTRTEIQLIQGWISTIQKGKDDDRDNNNDRDDDDDRDNNNDRDDDDD
jgi:hypothetical protein